MLHVNIITQITIVVNSTSKGNSLIFIAICKLLNSRLFSKICTTNFRITVHTCSFLFSIAFWWTNFSTGGWNICSNNWEITCKDIGPQQQALGSPYKVSKITHPTRCCFFLASLQFLLIRPSHLALLSTPIRPPRKEKCFGLLSQGMWKAATISFIPGSSLAPVMKFNR